MSLTIGIDVGGTKLSGGVVTEDGEILAKSRQDSPARDTSAIASAIGSLISELRSSVRDGSSITQVGVAAAGYVSLDRSTVIYAPNLAWRDEPLRDLIASECGLSVVVENDANAAAWGEYRFGAGVGARTLLMATIGTGVGGGLVHQDQVYRGGFGGAAEFGHIRLVENGRECPCGLHGCWETYASGTALTRDARSLAESSGPSLLLELAGGSVSEITGPLVSEAADKGCPVAIAAFDEIERRIGEGLATLSAVLDPDVIVIGGGVSEAHELNLAQILESYTAHVSGGSARPTPRLVRGALGNRAGIIGVSDLARA